MLVFAILGVSILLYFYCHHPYTHIISNTLPSPPLVVMVMVMIMDGRGAYKITLGLSISLIRYCVYISSSMYFLPLSSSPPLSVASIHLYGMPSGCFA